MNNTSDSAGSAETVGQQSSGTDQFRLVQCPGCMGLQAVPERYDEIGELYAHMTGHGCLGGVSA